MYKKRNIHMDAVQLPDKACRLQKQPRKWEKVGGDLTYWEKDTIYCTLTTSNMMRHTTRVMDIENGSFQPIDIKFEKTPASPSNHTFGHLYKYGCIHTTGWLNYRIHLIDIFWISPFAATVEHGAVAEHKMKQSDLCVKVGILTFNHKQSVWFNIRDVTLADPARYTDIMTLQFSAFMWSWGELFSKMAEKLPDAPQQPRHRRLM